MADAIDIKQVLKGSTADVSIDALSKKGFKQVKVLDQATISRLITEAVDRVISQRSESMSQQEREEIIRQTRQQLNVDQLKQRLQAARGEVDLKDERIAELENAIQNKLRDAQSAHAQKDAKISELESAIHSREVELEKLRSLGVSQAEKDAQISELESAIHSREAELEKLRSLGASQAEKDVKIVELKGMLAELEGMMRARDAELEELRKRSSGDGGLAQVLSLLGSQLQQGNRGADTQMTKALEALTNKIEKMSFAGGGGGGGGGNVPVPDDIALDFLVKGDDKLESNIDDVKVKQAKAGDVKGALAKLKKLQKGG